MSDQTTSSSSSSLYSPPKFVTIRFPPGPLGMQLEPCRDHPHANMARVARFVDDYPWQSGAARASGRLVPGDYVVRVACPSTMSSGGGSAEEDVATDYHAMMTLLQSTHLERIVTIQSAQWEEQRKDSSSPSDAARKNQTASSFSQSGWKLDEHWSLVVGYRQMDQDLFPPMKPTTTSATTSLQVVLAPQRSLRNKSSNTSRRRQRNRRTVPSFPLGRQTPKCSHESFCCWWDERSLLLQQRQLERQRYTLPLEDYMSEKPTLTILSQSAPVVTSNDSISSKINPTHGIVHAQVSSSPSYLPPSIDLRQWLLRQNPLQDTAGTSSSSTTKVYNWNSKTRKRHRPPPKIRSTPWFPTTLLPILDDDTKLSCDNHFVWMERNLLVNRYHVRMMSPTKILPTTITTTTTIPLRHWWSQTRPNDSYSPPLTPSSGLVVLANQSQITRRHRRPNLVFSTTVARESNPESSAYSAFFLEHQERHTVVSTYLASNIANEDNEEEHAGPVRLLVQDTPSLAKPLDSVSVHRCRLDKPAFTGDGVDMDGIVSHHPARGSNNVERENDDDQEETGTGIRLEAGSNTRLESQDDDEEEEEISSGFHLEAGSRSRLEAEDASIAPRWKSDSVGEKPSLTTKPNEGTRTIFTKSNSPSVEHQGNSPSQLSPPTTTRRSRVQPIESMTFATGGTIKPFSSNWRLQRARAKYGLSLNKLKKRPMGSNESKPSTNHKTTTDKSTNLFNTTSAAPKPIPSAKSPLVSTNQPSVLDFSNYSSEQSIVFEPGPLGLQLEPCSSEHGYPAKIVRFVDGGPQSPGPARRSGQLCPGDYIVRVQADGDVVATTYIGIMTLLQQHTWTTRKVVFRSAWHSNNNPLLPTAAPTVGKDHVESPTLPVASNKPSSDGVSPLRPRRRLSPLLPTTPLPYDWTPLPYDWVNHRGRPSTTNKVMVEDKERRHQQYVDEASALVEHRRQRQLELRNDWDFSNVVLDAISVTAEAFVGCLRKESRGFGDDDDDDDDDDEEVYVGDEDGSSATVATERSRNVHAKAD